MSGDLAASVPRETVAAWRQAAASLPALDLPTDRPRRPGAASPVRSVERRLAAAAAASPEEALAAWAALLGRVTGAGRFGLAASLAGADAVLVEAAVEGDPSLVDLALRLAAAVADPQRPRMPWRALAASPCGGEPGEAPPVRVAFRAGAGRKGSRAVGGEWVEDSPAGFDLVLTWRGGEAAALSYAPDLFDTETAARLLARFEALLAAATSDPATPPSRLSYLAADERGSLTEWGTGPALPAGAAAADASRRLERLFAARAAAQPDALAVCGGGVSWSYRELARHSGEVAERLRRRGLAPGSRVGIVAARRPGLVAAMLGTLEAGCAYVPLDPRYPADRLAFMLADSGAAAVLVDRELLDVLPPAAPPALVLGETDGAGIATAQVALDAAGPPSVGPEPDAARLAYVIYTSGSTGRPKGVAIEHRSAAALIAWAASELSAEELSGVAAVTSVCFDLSIFEIFLPLAVGGAVVLFDDALGVADHRGEPPITLLNTVPSAAAELARLGGIPESVRTIDLAGEPLRRDLVERLYALPHVARVLDLYGPSEDTTYSTWSEVERGAERPVTIGRPIGGTRVVLVDRRLRPVGIGVPGELCLAGDGLARGYLGRPALTAASFVPDAFAAEMGGAPGSRLYRTGDLARWLPDGRLDFLGRIDHQVKVRGFRIELGEIETTLCRQPGVAEAVVVVHREALAATEDEGADGSASDSDARLVAYWAADEAHARAAGAPDEGELRDALRRSLPDYMIPGQWVRLEALPRNPNGKVDRKALPAPPTGRRLAAAARAAGTSTESAVAAIWQRLLGLDEVGVDDDLFVLGGHSLIATRIAAAVREELGVALPPADLFEHSTVARLAARIDQLAAGGPGAPRHAVEPPPVRRARRDRPLPLGFPQEQVWLIHRLDRQNLAYNFQYTVRLRGPLVHAVLERALSEIVRRHESLRTTFPAVDGEPVQVIHPPWPARVPRVDLGGLPAARREAAAERLAARLVRRSFDVTRLPLVDWTVLRLDAQDHLFVQSEQHFVHDGWSIGVFLSEVEAIYGAFVAGRPSPLPELPVQYADFAVWQREWLTGEALEAQLSYWRRQLADPPPPLELAGDRPRGRRQSFRGDRLDLDVPPALYHRLRALGRREGWTLFMLMAAAFEALVARMTGRTDFLLGSGVANRRRREIEPLIGMIVNTLVLRADVSGEPTFRELVARVRSASLGLQAHQDLPFEALVAELQPQRDLSRNPLFQHMFSFHDAPVPDLEFGGLSGELVERHNGSAKADWNVIVKPRGSQRIGRAPSAEDDVLRVLWEFATDLFDRATIERTWGHYLVLLAALADDPEAAVWRAPLLTAAEREQLAAWNRTEEPLPDLDVAAAVAARAAELPEAPAVVAAGQALTYGELSAAAARLAQRLAAAGVGPETVVAVALPSSPEMVTALLGVLFAGGAYLPLDPEHPAERLAYTLADSGARVLITGESAGAALPAFGGRVLTMAAGGDEEEKEAPAPLAGGLDPVQRLHPDNLAYVIYTSGSTGRPKGTGLTRRGLANLVAWHLAEYGLGPGHRTTLAASPAFDASVWELWPTLVAGAAVHVPPPEVRAAPRALYRWLAAERITSCFLPTPLGEALLDEEPPPGVALEALLVGGDALHRPPPPGLPFRLVNHYGPTEDTVVTTAGEIEAAGRAVAPPGAPIHAAPSIGRPIANTRVHLVDRRLEPVPVGVPGELAIAGDGLARGYLGRPALTAEYFLPDPFAERPGGRLYRTGDLARRLPDGRIDFLGRLDHQVKVRGFRIELGEIEKLLEEVPAVRRAVVVAVAGEDAGGAGALAAFVVPAGGAGRAAAADGRLEEELAAHLVARLPSYMVPGSLTVLAALPLSPTGKVDRRALVERAARGAASTGGGGERTTPPRDPGERLVAEIWSDVLGLAPGTPLGVHDDFFALGGHSLRAAKAAARVGDAFGVELELPDLFENPTIARLAAAVAERLAAGERAEPIPRLGDEEKAAGVPLSFAQERLWLIDQLIARRSTYHVARAWSCRGPLDAGALEAALATVVGRHEALRTALVDEGAADGGAGDGAGRGVVQRVVAAAEAAPALPLHDLSPLPPGRREAAERRLLAHLVEAPFDLGRAPLVRAALVRRGPDDHLFVLVLHHVVADGWSMPRLSDEIAEAYRARLAGEAPDLPALPVQYADFAVWQRRRLAGRPLDRLAAFWREQLLDAPRLLDLPTDRPRRAVRSLHGGRVEARLEAAAVEPLRRLSRELGATLFMALLAGLSALLGRLARQDDVVIGTPIAGRGRREVEDLVGFFVNTLALRTRLGPGVDGSRPGFAALLGRVRRSTLAAYAHQEMPFERLVELLAPERDLGHSPLFQVTLALEAGGSEPGGAERPLLAGCIVDPVPVARREAHFELTLFAGERADGGLDLAFTYDRDLFDATTVERLGTQLGRLLAAACADPDRPVARLALLDAAERRQLVTVAPAAVPAAEVGGDESSLPARVAFWAQERPESVALVADGLELTWAELLDHAQRLARHLHEVAPLAAETPVAVCLDRSPEQVVAILAVLAAGGACLPLDPEEPAERLAGRLAASGAALAIAGRGTVERLRKAEAAARAGRPDLLCIVLDEEGALAPGAQAPAEQAESAVWPPAAGEAVALLVDSGGPGAEDGAGSLLALTHGALTAGLGAAADGQTRLLLAPASSASGVRAIWGALAAGGRLAVPPPGPIGIGELDAFLGRHRVTEAELPAGLVHLLLEREPDSLAGLHRLAVGDDATLAPQRLRRLPAAEVRPEEAMDASQWMAGGAADRAASRGEGPAGGGILLLDRHLEPVPPGGVGEVHRSDVAAGRGLWGQPGRTAASWLPDPFAGEPGHPAGGRLRRTGLLARRRGDGGAVAVEGHSGDAAGRRERRRVEAELAALPGLAAAVVIQSSSGEASRPTAFAVAADPGAPPAAEALRRALAERLPSSLLPAELLVVAELPLTAAGAVDREALAASIASPDTAGAAAAPAPRGPLEERLAELWQEVLPTERLSAGDDFFALGGHSLLASRLVARVRESFGIPLALGSLFRASTFGALAAEIERATAALDAAGDAGEAEDAVGVAVGAASAPAPTIGRAVRTARRRLRGDGGDGR